MSMCERPEQVRQVSNRLMGEKKSSLNVQTLLVCVCARTHADGTTAADGTTTTVPAASYLKLNL